MNRIVPATFLILVLTIGLLASCSHAITTSAYTAVPNNLATYKTYAWVTPGDTTLNARRDDKMYAGLIQETANGLLKKKGFTLDNQNPDAVFSFDTAIDDKIEYRQTQTQVTSTIGYGYGYGGFSYGYVGPGYYAGSNVPIYENGISSELIDEGTISYSMFDRKTGKLLWRGTAKQKLDANTKIEKSIKDATTYIFMKLEVK
ncbi:MAG TPA: DUF4136 domain-containing protein [Chryseolinea sp.]|nr:DUF4136 domain-containing protein [Chryseolinea sp.]